MRYEGQIYRPPCEAHSLIIQATVGCPWNRCAFCSMYKSKKHRHRPWEEVTEDLRAARGTYGQVKSIFLADGNVISLPSEHLLTILREIRRIFPEVEHVGTYGGTKYILQKSAEELERLRREGLSAVYLGLESGDDEVLRRMNKGVSAAEATQAGQALKKAGFPASLYVLIGLGGMELTEQHARNTAQVINAIGPDIVRPRTLYIQEDTPLWHRRKRGDFREAGPREALLEVRTLVEDIQVPVDLVSDHITNYLPIYGRLPEQRAELLEQIDRTLTQADLSRLRPQHFTHL